jgi:hypothetical protein
MECVCGWCGNADICPLCGAKTQWDEAHKDKERDEHFDDDLSSDADDEALSDET